MIWTGIKSILFFTLLVSVTFIYLLRVYAASLFYRLRGKPVNTRVIHRIATNWGRTLFGLVPGWKIQISGKEHIPLIEKPMVIVANHESATDILAIYFLDLQFKWLSKDAIFKIPMMGYAMKQAEYISIKRGNRSSHQEALEKSKKVIHSGFSMLFFPEGTRSTLGHPKEFKIGAFKLASDCNVEILPIVLKGAGTLLKKGTLAPHSAVLKVHVMAPTKKLEHESVDDFTARVQKLIADYHATI